MRETSAEPVQRYISELFAQETALLRNVREHGERIAPGMQISPYEGKLLQVLASAIGARHILEIGTFVGYSTLWVAGALPPEGRLDSLEVNPEHARIARDYCSQSPNADMIYIHEGKALERLATLTPPPEGYDLIFLDAAKSEYPQYLDVAGPMLRCGGLLVADNTLLFGHMVGEPKKQASAGARYNMQIFNETLAASPNYQTIMLPTEEGLLIARKLQ